MQNDELKQRFEEIDKRFAFSEKKESVDLTSVNKKLEGLQLFRENMSDRVLALDASVNNLLESDVTKNDQIISLQNRVDSLEQNSVSDENLAQIQSNTDSISAINNSITNLSASIESNTTSINDLITSDAEQTEDITNLSLNYSHLNSDVESMSESVSSLTTKYNLHESKIQVANSDIEELEGRITALENGSEQPSNSDIPETYNYFNKAVFKQNQETYGLLEHFFTCFFLTDPTSICKIKFKANVTIINEITYTKTLNVVLNDEIIYSKSYPNLETIDDTIEFEYYFYPTSNNNNIILKSAEKNNLKKKSRVKFKDCEIEIFGRNVTVLNKDLGLIVYPCKDKYYLTKNDYEKGYAKIMSINDTAWEDNFFEIPRMCYAIDDANATATDKVVYTIFNHTFLPKVTYDAENSKYVVDETNYKICGAFSNVHYAYTATSDAIPIHATGAETIAFNDVYAVSTPGENDTSICHGCFVKVTHGYCLCMNNIQEVNIADITVNVNGVAAPGKWVWAAPVIYKDWVDVTNHPYQCIGLDEFGHNYFFPSLNSTYSVDLGLGAQTTAYGQPDGSINVYMSLANKLFKKVLTFNSTLQQYELTSSTVIANANEYIEGISDDYFIKEGETWSYVPSSSITE